MLPNISSSSSPVVSGAAGSWQDIPPVAAVALAALQRGPQPEPSRAAELAGRLEPFDVAESASASLPVELWRHHVTAFLGEDVFALQHVALTSRQGLGRLARQSLEEKWQALASSEVLAPWLEAERAQDPTANKLTLMTSVIAAINELVDAEHLPVADRDLEEKVRWVNDAQFVTLFGQIVEQLSIQPIVLESPERCREVAARLRAMLPDLAEALGDLEELSIPLGLCVLPPEIGLLTGLRTRVLRGNQLRWLPAEFSRLRALTVLDLQGNRLSRIPAEVYQLPHLQNLDLSRNQLREITDEIGGLADLAYLDLAQNQLSGLPSAIGQCRNLHLLDVRRNRLQALPEEICGLPLRNLVASGNRLQELPQALGQLQHLNTLRVSDNPIEQLPPTFCDLAQLEHLDFSNTQVRDFPPGCHQLERLLNLEMRASGLERLPRGIEQMPALQILDMTDNQLTEMPIELRHCPSLQHLRLGNNRITAFRFQAGDFPGLKNLSLKQNTIHSPEGLEHLSSLELMEYDTPLQTTLIMRGPRRGPAPARRAVGAAQRNAARNLLNDLFR